MHDLKHTFGYRLRTAGVPFDDRQSLLGHKAAHVTTRYSAADIENLISFAKKASDLVSCKSPALTIVRSAGGPQMKRLVEREVLEPSTPAECRSLPPRWLSGTSRYPQVIDCM